MIKSYLVVLSALLMALVFVGKGSAGFSFVSGTIGDHSPTLVEAGETTAIQFQVRNTGVATSMRVSFGSVNSAWTVSGLDTNEFFINNNKTNTMSFDLKTSFATLTGNVEVVLEAKEEGSGFPVFVEVARKTFTIESIPPPGTFEISDPSQNDEIDGNFNVRWTTANNADVYLVLIWELDGTTRKDSAIFRQEEITGNQVSIDVTDFPLDTRFEVEVFATNRIGFSAATNNSLVIMTPEPPDIGSFIITSPQAGAEVQRTASFAWTKATDALDYTLYIFPETDEGEVAIEPILTIPLADTQSYTLAQAERLDGGLYYYVSVIAKSEFKERGNDGGHVRFFVTSLATFDLLLPSDEFVNATRRPEFRWQTAEGATEYQLEIYNDQLDPGVPWIRQTIPHPPIGNFATYTIPNGQKLPPNSLNFWTVTAVNSLEQRQANQGYLSFTTSPITDFKLIAPLQDEAGVSRSPAFVWEPIPAGSTTVQYGIEIAPELPNGQPDLSRQYRNGNIAPNGVWNIPITLDVAQTYLWRMWVYRPELITDTAYSSGGYSRFTVYPFTQDDFDLILPADAATEVSIETQFQWEPVANAESYIFYLSIPSLEVGFPIITLPENRTSLDLVDEGIELNGNLQYNWTVYAQADGLFLTPVKEFTFTTAKKIGLDTCDLVEHLVLKQVISDSDFNQLTLDRPIDAATIIRLQQDVTIDPCDKYTP